MKNALKGILSEAECLSEIHSKVTNRLRCGKFQELKIWLNSAYTPVRILLNDVTSIKEFLRFYWKSGFYKDWRARENEETI